MFNSEKKNHLSYEARRHYVESLSDDDMQYFEDNMGEDKTVCPLCDGYVEHIEHPSTFYDPGCSFYTCTECLNQTRPF